MARLPRLVLPGYAHHLIQRGHNQQPIVRSDADRAAYLEFLRDASRAERVAVHGYALLDNQVHLLVTPENDSGLSRMMQTLGRRYVGWFNRAHGHTGTLWEGRFRGTVLEAERYLLPSLRCIELAPVLAGQVAVPQDSPWTSYAHHVGLRSDPMIAEHPLYWALGNTPFDRQAAYRSFVEQGVSAQERQVLTDAALKSWALGSPGFLAQIGTLVKRPVSPRPRGRPPRRPSAEAVTTG